ncbi:MAG: transposase [Bellilinea sp.]
MQGYDYSQNGAYFVTICVANRQSILWTDIKPPSDGFNDLPLLSKLGSMVNSAIQNIPVYYPNVSVEKYVIMPDHVHLILLISGSDEHAMHRPKLSTIISQMKGYVTKTIGVSIWQKSYFDRIIRSESEFNNIWEYIDTNLVNWENDDEWLNS